MARQQSIAECLRTPTVPQKETGLPPCRISIKASASGRPADPFDTAGCSWEEKWPARDIRGVRWSFSLSEAWFSMVIALALAASRHSSVRRLRLSPHPPVVANALWRT